jgi:MarR-like DNA-binding transcriptional regulator SgrR of sgrS sRNA
MIDQALQAPNAWERRKVLERIEGRLREEAAVMFLLHKKVNTVYQPGIRGVTMSPLGWIDFKTVWVQSRR